MKSKKILSFLTAILMVSTLLCACKTSDPPPSPQTPPPTPSSPAPTKVSEYPKKDIKIVIPFAPGGGSDILTRAIMKYIDVPVSTVAINTEGAGGLVGAQEVYYADPNGYTLLAHNPMNLVGQSLGGTSDIPLWKDLTTICFMVDDWTIVSTNKATGITSYEELVEYAKANPNKLKWGVTGAQSVSMADSLRAGDAMGIECTVIPYDGGAATRSALLGNHIQLETSTSSDIKNVVASGDVIPLFAISPDHCPTLPNVPTLIDKGIKVDTGAPRAYYAPPNLGADELKYLEDAFKKVAENEEFIKECANLGFTVKFVGSKDATSLVNSWYTAIAPAFERFKTQG